MNGYEKRTQKKREKIIESAQELFLLNGITNTTIEQIAEKAQVSRVTIFKYFGDKEELVKKAVHIWVNALLQEYEKIIQSNQPFHIKLTRILYGHEQIIDEAIKTDIRGNGELMGFIRELVKANGLSKIMALIEEGKRVGAVDPSLDNEAILIYFSAFSPIISDPEYINKDKAVQDSLFNLFMGGLIRDWYKLKNSMS